MIITTLIAIAAITLDWLLGEPSRWHPLVGFGRLADWIEQWLNRAPKQHPLKKRLLGVMGLVILALPFTAMTAGISFLPSYLENAFCVIILYLAIGHKSLHDHVKPIATALIAQDDSQARKLVGRIVSRDPETLDIPKAACESVLENGNDSIFGALFWFFVAGIPGVVFYRISNTLDAMWGYRNERFRYFGWGAARLDDLMNYVPARLTSLSYALIAPLVWTNSADEIKFSSWKHSQSALDCWRTQGAKWDSPNAGPVMAAGAGALRVTLGGPARYGGKWHDRPVLGTGPSPTGHDIIRALRLVSLSVGLWLVISLLTGGMVNA